MTLKKAYLYGVLSREQYYILTEYVDRSDVIITYKGLEKFIISNREETLTFNSVSGLMIYVNLALHYIKKQYKAYYLKIDAVNYFMSKSNQ